MNDDEAAVTERLRASVPSTFDGRDTEFGVHTPRGYFQQQLNFDLEQELAARDWLTFSEQNLCMVTAGAVFHDEIGLEAVRERFAYYPRDVWLYLMIAAWWKVHPEVNLVGRAGFVGDELGSALIGSQVVHGLMRLCFLLERQYAPYSKWFGTAFSRLECGAVLSPILSRVLAAESWQAREEALMAAYDVVAGKHNALGITPPVATEVTRMWEWPFKVLWGDFPGALANELKDPAVKQIAERWPVGGIEQVRDVLWSGGDRRRLVELLDTAE
ncbi:DUF4037 domain-containing protein [Kribbella antiqua]|uniref:DUF4037 domain-containing protein n=1 Tax=Kribbella antiqua TaxID=2512217 RepID=UPI0018EEA561|nr:DUF4037 domain-containing protein [Kribbella antiqua]